MRVTSTVKRPRSLRRPAAALALGVSAAVLAAPAQAQDADEEDAGEVQLETLRIEDYTADSNPYTQDGAPYKARVSGDARRVQPLSETPATITVLTEQQIEESGATDLRDILDNQPGVTVGTGENGNAFGDRYIIRGHEARSDVFVDGLRDPGMTTRESFAVEQVEITKGPSSTFAGRGSTGGAVNSITKQASTAYNFTRVDAGIGTDDYYRGTVDANFRLNDYAAVRVNGLYAYEEIPGRNYSDRERWGVAVSTLLQPTDTLEILLDYYHLSASDMPDLGSYVPGATGTSASDVVIYDPWDDVPAYAQAEDFLDSDVDTFTARITWEIDDTFTVRNSTRYGETSNGYVLTGLRGGAYDADTGLYAPLTLSSHQGYQEVEYLVNQINLFADFYTGGLRHQLILGGEYSDYQVANGVYSVTNNGATNCEVAGRGGTISGAYCITDENRNVLAIDLNTLLQREITKGGIDSDWEVETASVYLMDTIEVNEWLTLNGGFRIDRFDYSNSVGLTDPVLYAYSDTLWNGNAGITVKPAEEGIVYFSWGTATNINGGESDLGGNCGYGGVCVSGTTDYTVGDGSPETTESLELGTKWDLFDDRLMLTAALFQITKSGVFESAGDGYSEGGSLNTGKNRVRGIEIGLVGNITDQLMAQAGFAVMESEILESTDATAIGHRLANFANESFNAQVRYQATPDFAFGGTATYQAKMYAGQSDTAASYNSTLEIYSYRVPSYWTFDAFATYRINEALSARVNVTNVTDADYYLAAYRSGHFLYKGDERRTTLTLTGRF